MANFLDRVLPALPSVFAAVTAVAVVSTIGLQESRLRDQRQIDEIAAIRTKLEGEIITLKREMATPQKIQVMDLSAGKNAMIE
jgi:hypothetical protein